MLMGLPLCRLDSLCSRPAPLRSSFRPKPSLVWIAGAVQARVIRLPRESCKMAECWRSWSDFLFVFLQRRFMETGVPRWTRLMSGIPASERWGMSLNFSTASKEQLITLLMFSDPRGHHCLQHHRGCDWVLRAAGFAAGVHRPSHHHSNRHPNWTFCFHHSRRTSRLSLGADGAVRLSCPQGFLDTECHLDLLLMH